eukprot:TRINITY_DN37383_c0_g1_i1.p1 TRINITY_DN37383_c0_g1~~TRINITY_DN37383_c0_g1_i1.p1  ORF type:complete len:407 (-),score=54.81 TRINITY_DN37383_c0_g1_i1:45-1136(-)
MSVAESPTLKRRLLTSLTPSPLVVPARPTFVWDSMGPLLGPEEAAAFIAVHAACRDAARVDGCWTFPHILWRWSFAVQTASVLSVRLPAEQAAADCDVTETTRSFKNLRAVSWFADSLTCSEDDDDAMPRFVSPSFVMAEKVMTLLWHPQGHPLSRKNSRSLYLECTAMNWPATFRLRAGRQTRLYTHRFTEEAPRWGDADFTEITSATLEEEGDCAMELGMELMDDHEGPWPVHETESAVHVKLSNHAERSMWATRGDGLLSEACSFGHLLWCPKGMCADPDEPWWDPDAAFYLMHVPSAVDKLPTSIEVRHDGFVVLSSLVEVASHPGIGAERWTPAIVWTGAPSHGEIDIILDWGSPVFP